MDRNNLEKETQGINPDNYFNDGQVPYKIFRQSTITYYTIEEGDWDRLRMMIENLRPPSSFFQGAFWASIGLLANAIFGLLGIWYTQNVPIRIQIIAWVIFSVSLLSSFLFWFLIKKEKRDFETSVNLIKYEMEKIQSRNSE